MGGAQGAGAGAMSRLQLSPGVAAKAWYVFYFAAQVCVGPFLYVYFHDQGLSKAQVGLLGFLRPWVATPASFLWPALADRLHAHRAVLLATFAGAAAVRLLLLRGHSFAFFLAVALAAEALGKPAGALADAAVMRICEKKSDYGKYRLWGAVGWGSFSTVAGALIANLGIRWAFYFHALLSLPCLWLGAQLYRGPGGGGGAAGQGGAACGGATGEAGEAELQPLVAAPSDGGLGGAHEEARERQRQAGAPQGKGGVHGQGQGTGAVGPAVGVDRGPEPAGADGGDPPPSDVEAARPGPPPQPGISYPHPRQHQQPPGEDLQHMKHLHQHQQRHDHDRDRDDAHPHHRHAHPHPHHQQQQQPVEPRPPAHPPPRGSASPEASHWRQLARLLATPRVALFLAAATAMGYGFGTIDSFLFLYLQQLGASETLMGLTLTITCAAEVPAFQLQDRLLDRYGVTAVLDLVQATYALRLALYAALPYAMPYGGVAWVLPVEVLHGVTFACGWGAGTVNCRLLAPEGLGATMQGIFQGLYFGLGYGLGALIGGWLGSVLGWQRMFACASAVMLSVWLCLLAVRRVVGALAKSGGEGRWRGGYQELSTKPGEGDFADPPTESAKSRA